jgi:pyridinium-3,5-bisthiocarboxylic acid mononucleotide nickel chelatase
VKILYFDCFAGAAGDMIVGALLDAGLPFEELKRALGSLAVDGWDISVDRVLKTGVTATKFRVHEHQHHSHPHHSHGTHHSHHSLAEIESAIGRSALSDSAKGRAIAMFRRLGQAEADIHGMSVDKVHLHEVGAIDSIIDIVGAVFALEWFAADRIVVSPLNVGGGTVRSAHGVFPVPAPATLKLLGSAPVYSSGVQMELLTPTGALILTEYASAFGPVPAMTVERVGYGAGDRELPETPNVVRVLVGQAASDAAAMRVVTLECEIDDMNPQIFGALMEKLYAAGALEVYYSSVQMKKNRPGTLMTIVARPDQREALTNLVFRESTTIGVRYQEMWRECLDREMITVGTAVGPVRFKVAHRNGQVLNAQPEFDDLAKLSAERGIPIKEVQALALKAWLER